MENQEEGLDILQVEATDLDAGENGLKAYSLRGEGSEMFHIDSESGKAEKCTPKLIRAYKIQSFYSLRGSSEEDFIYLSVSLYPS